MQQPTDNPLWTTVDDYLTGALIPADPIQQATLAANAAANLPTIDVSPTQGKFLHLLAVIQGASRILEIGTLGGYSTIWLARALPQSPDEGGKLITLEFEPKHAAVAQRNIANAGFAHLVEIRIGPAADSLARLHAENPEPFDLIFIDADKPNNPVYLEWALKLSRKGTVIVVDNVIRDGEIANSASNDSSVQGTRTMFEMLSTYQHGEARLQATALQTVGSKGYDGLAFALVL